MNAKRRVSRISLILLAGSPFLAAGCISLLAYNAGRTQAVDLLRQVELLLIAGVDFGPTACGPDGPLSVIVPDCPLDVVCFTPACEGHDDCYVTCDATQQQCDQQFHADMRSLCSATYEDGDPRLVECNGLAYIYWQAVVRFGSRYFEDGRANCPQPLGEGDKSESPMPPFEDADDDLLPDDWERRIGCDPGDPTDAMADFDGDGLVNLQEYLYGTDPFVPDGQRKP